MIDLPSGKSKLAPVGANFTHGVNFTIQRITSLVKDKLHRLKIAIVLRVKLLRSEVAAQ